jgi:hypothetical protein
MTESDHSASQSRPHGPKRRGDTSRPAKTRSGSRRGGDRRPYPTASTTTRVSPAKPGSASTRSRSRGSTAARTPATVWPTGPAPIDLDTAWPTPIITKIVDSFSEPSGRVALLPWPTAVLRPRQASLDGDGVIDHTPGTEPDAELADALTTVEGLDRTGRVVRVATDATTTGPGPWPFWTDLVRDPGNRPATVFPPAPSEAHDAVLDGTEDPPATTDLIITSLRPEHSGDQSSDLVALVAARLLRLGGILVVLTHCDWPAGELIDPTGAVVASAQNADLLYLQHIVALHAPVRDGRLATELIPDTDGSAAEQQARTAHRAAVRGLSAPHRRIHSDVLVFAQPHDCEPPRPAATEQAFKSGVLR